MISTLLPRNLGITTYLFVGSVFEEPKLSAEYRQDYARYQQKVPRFLPPPMCMYRGHGGLVYGDMVNTSAYPSASSRRSISSTL